MKIRAFSELATLKMQLAHEREQRELREAHKRAQALQAARERQLFAHAVGPVHRLKDHRLADVERPRPGPIPRQRERDERAVVEALSDELDVDTLLETDEGLSFRRPGIGLDVLKRLRRGHWVIQAQVDLHGLRREEARERLAEFIRVCARRGFRCVRVVHGKGLGSPGKSPVLKSKVRAWLVQKREVIAFIQARAAEGGAGALVVLLDAGA
ncbi:MAG TPA: Smr/MutS family protein [Burkholderiaceae bacterium]|nr:Smr/MutS family protein [Burkholderiaceae bacterium]